MSRGLIIKVRLFVAHNGHCIVKSEWVGEELLTLSKEYTTCGTTLLLMWVGWLVGGATMTRRDEERWHMELLLSLWGVHDDDDDTPSIQP